MLLYLYVENKKIIDVNTEEVSENFKEYNINSIDDLYKQLNLSDISEDIEEKLRELLSNEEDKNITTSYDIKHWVSNRSFGELIDMYESQEITKPEMQREFIWDSLKSSRLIESIILGLPIPPLFLLEIGKNKYEIIDGYQRLITLVNYVTGKPWYDNQKKVKKLASKLSSKLLLHEIRGKTFQDLPEELKRTIKRSTIPLIEFRQIVPENHNSKYLIFERINTGSEKLNLMQIRKSLAYGVFIKSLYKYAQQNEKFLNLFSANAIKKDEHVEAFLRVKVMSEIYYKKYSPSISGMKYILNEYCENHKNIEIEEDFYISFCKGIDFCYNFFKNDVKKMFRRINNENKSIGNLNISILEAFLGVLSTKNIENLDQKKLFNNYTSKMKQIFNYEQENPFSVSTGTIDSIKQRFEIFETIIGDKNELQ